MMKKLAAGFLILSIAFFALFFRSGSRSIPTIIDYATKQFQNRFFHETLSPSLLASNPFNGGKELSTFFQHLKNTCHINTAVETGTFMGQTTLFFGHLFNTVHTIEISPDYFAHAKSLLSQQNNIQQHLGNSPEVLHQLLPALQGKRVVFYLDAHWEDYWPLLSELEEISKTHKDNCVIVVDDVKVPGYRDIGYDSYKNVACSYKYMKDQLDKVFSEYTIHYLLPENRKARAKLVALPKAWSKLYPKA